MQIRAYLLSALLIAQTVLPTAMLALTSGPTQPEFSAFEPVGASNNVDLFSGDFSYNIPLFELPGPDGGYPFNLSYASGAGMETEASWVGLGWSLNPGAINRTVRGIPDDYNGKDQVIRSNTYMMKDWTLTGTRGVNFEILGAKLDGLGLALGNSMAFNAYRGWSVGLNIGASKATGKASYGLSLGINSGTGATLTPNFTLGGEDSKTSDRFKFGTTFSSGEGLSSVGLSYSKAGGTDVNRERKNDDGTTETKTRNIGSSMSANVSYNRKGFTPAVQQSYTGFNGSGQLEGGAFFGPSVGGYVGLSYSEQVLRSNGDWINHPARGYFHHTSGEESFEEHVLSDFNRETETIPSQETPNLALASATPDIYSLSGQGTGGQFIPMRSAQVGVTDSRSTTIMGGLNLGVQIDPGASALVGADVGGNFSYAASSYPSGGFMENLRLAEDALPTVQPARHEPFYFRASGDLAAGATARGETRYSLAGFDRPFMLSLERQSSSRYSPAPFRYNDANITEAVFNTQLGSSSSLASQQVLAEYAQLEREPRNATILPVYDHMVNAPDGEEGVSMFPSFRTTIHDLTGSTMVSPESYATLNPISPTYGTTTTVDNTVADESSDYVVGFVNTNNTGLRYNYGIPLWNIKQVEALFSTSESSSACGLVDMQTVSVDQTDTEKSLRKLKSPNKRESDAYHKYTYTPRFVHTYLLSSVLGPDYIDLGDPGIDDSDSGYWVDFRYAYTARGTNLYRWRAPYNKARYDRGLGSSSRDDKASLLYGEREQALLTEVRTKTHIAKFFSSGGTGYRTDARGADGLIDNDAAINQPDGSPGGNGQASYRLDSIQMLSRNDTEVPILTVHFEYDTNNGLTKGAPNAADGKLKLTSVSTTYRNNQRGKQTPYNFEYLEATASTYSDGTTRPPGATDYEFYSETGQDRWGRNIVRVADGPCYTGEDPYSVQSIARVEAMAGGQAIDQSFDLKKETDLAKSVWSLNKITLPSGSSINVHYESDDYAYVQDRRALQMTPIASIGDFVGNNLEGNKSVPTGDFGAADETPKIYFPLERNSLTGSLPPGDPKAIVENYLRGVHGIPSEGIGSLSAQDLTGSQVMFKLRTKFSARASQYDAITGYGEIDEYGVEGDYGWVRFKTIRLGKQGKRKNYHPFAAAAWQFAKARYPKALTSNNFDPNGRTTVVELGTEFAAAFMSVGDLFRNYYSSASKKGLGGEVDLTGCYLRLASPDGIKYGDGSRVKAIVVNDNWNLEVDNTADGGTQVTYGQVYDYTTTRNGEVISSGVATNEPSLGFEECALQHAKKFTEEAIFRSDQEYSIEYPANRSVLPGASVGYSEVTVRSLAGEANRVLKAKERLPYYLSNFESFSETPITTTGETVNTFYTCKDYPVLTSETTIDKSTPATSFIMGVIFNYINTSFHASQGYTTVLNDMHGKQRSTTHYGHRVDGERGEQINRTEYTYFDRKVPNNYGRAYNEAREVVSDLPIVSHFADGTARTAGSAQLGISHSVTYDLRESSSEGGELTIGSNGIVLGIFPGMTVFPSASLNVGTTRTAVVNKVVRKTGFLQRVDVTDGQSRQTTENIGFDALTGEAVLTTVSNSYDEPVFALKTPAYHKYEGMGPSYINSGATVVLDVLGVGDAQCNQLTATVLNGNNNVLYPGDELFIHDGPGASLTPTFREAPLLTVLSSMNNVVTLEASIPIGDVFKNNILGFPEVPATIVRSGRRNLLTTGAGTVQAFVNPTETERYSEVLSLAANTFTDDWQVPNPSSGEVVDPPQSPIEPGASPSVSAERGSFRYGSKGIWRPHQTFAYVADRTALGPQSADERLTPEDRLRRLGVFADFEGKNDIDQQVRPFVHHTPFSNLSSTPNLGWRFVNEATAYGDAQVSGEPAEERNVLGVYSSAQYSRDGYLATAVAQNARSAEMSFAGFEHHPSGSLSEPVGRFTFGNLSPDEEKGAWSEAYNLVKPVRAAGNSLDNKITIDYTDHFTRLDLQPYAASVELTRTDGQETFTWSGMMNNVFMTSIACDADCVLPYQTSVVELTGNLSSCLPAQGELEGEGWWGRVILHYKTPVIQTVPTVAIADVGHTGNKSLSFVETSITSYKQFPQPNLNLQNGKRYVFSGWARSTATDHSASPNTALSELTNLILIDNATIVSEQYDPRILEGWRRFEITVQGVGKSPTLSFRGGAYYDDLRIAPENASFQSYVYDPRTYRLRATLDENNFATLYKYDDQGTLLATEKETERGRATIQETRSHTPIQGQGTGIGIEPSR